MQLIIKQVLLTVTLLCVVASIATAQTPSAVLDLESTTEGFLPPRMTTTQRDNIANPSDGMIIYNTTTGFINYYDVFDLFDKWKVLEPQVAPDPNPKVQADQVIIVGANQFVPINNDVDFQLGWGGQGAKVTNPSTTFMALFAPIQIPVGSEITKVTYYYKDNDPTEQMKASIRKAFITGTGIFTDLATIQSGTTYSNPNWVSSSITLSETTDDNSYYMIRISSDAWGSSDAFALRAAKIEYTLPTY